MAKNVTLSSMRTRVRRRADMVNSTFVSDAELTQYINDAKDDLYDLLVQKYGQDYYTTVSPETSFTTNVLSYALPDDFYKEVGVDLKVSGNNYVTCKPFMFAERNRFNTLLSRGVLGYQSTFYKIIGNQIQFTQSPGSGSAFRIWYVPASPDLVNDSDTFDGVNGWEKLIEVKAAIYCLQKEESDTSVLEREESKLVMRIEQAAESRQAGIGQRVTDVRDLLSDEIGIFGRYWW